MDLVRARSGLTGTLFTGLFDDAALYPPASTPLPDAVRDHAAHRQAPYAPLVGPFVCGAARLADVDAQATGPLDVALVAEGVDAVTPALDAVARCERVRLAAVEVRLGDHRVTHAARALDAVTVAAYVEVPVAQVDDAVVRQLDDAGLRLKLRTGGTAASAFPSEAALAGAISRCVAAELAVKCTAGLHHAVRHRDPQTGFEHHGFLNVLLAFHTAAYGHPAATLAEQDAASVANAILALTDEDVRQIRRLFGSIGTCSITDPLHDLTSLGLA